MPTVSRRRATFATILGSGTNTAVVSLQAVVLIPLYLRLIGPQLYGAWLSSGDVLIWLQAFDLGLPNLLIQRIGAAHGRSDRRTVAEYAASGIAALAAVAIVMTAIGIALAFLLPAVFHVGGAAGAELTGAIQLGALGTGIIIFNNSIIGYARAVQRTAFVNAVMVVSALSGFVISLAAVLRGAGLWSIPLGILARALVSLVGNIVFMAADLPPSDRRHFRIRGALIREMIHISPATALAGIGYALMNQSEAAIAGASLGPEAVLVLTMTKKAAEVGRSLLDVISYSAYGGFAHLVGSADRRRAPAVFGQIVALRWAAAVSIAAAYMAVNPSLVARWVGPRLYGGRYLTLVMAIQLIAVGHGYLINNLYRACGPVLRGSVALIVECVLRIPLMIVLLRWLGLVGLPLAAVITSTVSAAVVLRWITRLMQAFADRAPVVSKGVLAARALAFAVGAVLAATLYHPTWPFVVITGCLVAAAAGLIQALVDPEIWRALRLRPRDLPDR